MAFFFYTSAEETLKCKHNSNISLHEIIIIEIIQNDSQANFFSNTYKCRAYDTKMPLAAAAMNDNNNNNTA